MGRSNHNMYIGHDGRDYSTLEDLKRANEEYNAT